MNQHLLNMLHNYSPTIPLDKEEAMLAVQIEQAWQLEEIALVLRQISIALEAVEGNLRTIADSATR